MTSKEALKSLINNFKCIYSCAGAEEIFEIKNQVNEIFEALERLEKIDIIFEKILKYWGSISHTYNDKGDYYLLQVSYVCKYREELESIIQLFKSEKSININLK